MQKEIKQTWHFDQSPEEVSAYLTQPELLEQWLMQTDFQPTVGHKFRFITPSGKIIHCQVLQVTPFTTLSYSWQANSASGPTFDQRSATTALPKNIGTKLP